MNYSSDEDDQPLMFRRNLKVDKVKCFSQPPKPSKDSDSEDDKPLSTKISKVSKVDTNHVQKGLGTGPSPLPEPQVKDEDFDYEKLLSSKFRNKSNVGLSMPNNFNEKKPGTSASPSPKPQVDGEDSDDDKPLISKISNKSSVGSPLTKKLYQNGSASRENQSRNLVSNKRPPDDKRSSVQSSVKKSKLSDSSTPANRKPVPSKAEIKSDDDEEEDDSYDDSDDDDDFEDDDEVPVSQRIKKQAPSSSKSSYVQQKVVKKNSSSVNQTNKRSKKEVKTSEYSKPSIVLPGSSEGQKWTSLVHCDVIFPPAYTPHGVKMLYKGKPVDLTPEQEEVATMFAVMIDTDYMNKPKFKENFWDDWSKILGRNHTIQNLDDCDFRPIYEWHQAEKEKKKQMSTEVGNFRVEPPGLFRGRGEHPKKNTPEREPVPDPEPIVVEDEAGPSERPAKRQKVKKPVPSAASFVTRPEKYQYLTWPGTSDERKVVLNNMLARYQDRRVCAPRVMDWRVLTELGVLGLIEDLFRVRVAEGDVVFETMAWKKVLSVRQKVYRELCLEMFCSLEVDEDWMGSEVARKEIVHFRLGGRQYHCSLPQFAVWAGIHTQEEIEHPGFVEYLARGEIIYDRTNGFDLDSYWQEITGSTGRFNKSQGKVADIRDPILRVVHKLLVYSLFHRSTHHDKVYAQELWALWLFQHKGEGRYINIPWVLVCHLESCGAGNRSDGQICGGQYVTQVMRALGLLTPDIVSECSAPVSMQVIDMSDLRASRLIDKATGSLIGLGEVPPPPPPPPRPARVPKVPGRQADLQTVVGQIEQLRETQQVITSQLAVILYAFQRYQPVLERLAQDSAQAAGVELAEYAPPQVYVAGVDHAGVEQGEQAQGRAVDIDDDVPGAVDQEHDA